MKNLLALQIIFFSELTFLGCISDSKVTFINSTDQKEHLHDRYLKELIFSNTVIFLEIRKTFESRVKTIKFNDIFIESILIN